MNWIKEPLGAGLYLVSTPIGTARDITLRALDVLASADVLVAEDTRTLRKLMDLHGVPLNGRRVQSYHDHSKSGAQARLVDAVIAGQSVAYASEAGTPLVADPGYELVTAVRAAGGSVTAVPGASALLAALTVAGLPTDAVHFVGFLPAAQAARRAALSEVAGVAATLVLYESPKRVVACLKDAAQVLGPRRAVLARELTKRFEEVREGTLTSFVEEADALTLKGEFVILIDRAGAAASDEEELTAALSNALSKMSLKEAVALVAGATGTPRRTVYQIALSMKSEDRT
ncbi:MAG: 16S rRNA (cytidine(1402)-2'-O)-methyltransferase [Pseudomonadota bacterium]